MADFKVPERIKNALDNKKLSLSTKCPADSTKWSSLGWQLVANNPRIVIYTNDPNDQGQSKGYGKITANLDIPVFVMFLDMFEKMIDHDGEIKQSINNMGHTFFGGKRSEKPEVLSTLWFGKDKEGVVWLSVVMRDRPKIKFSMAPSSFHNFVDGDGTPIGESKVSQIFAKAYIRLLYNMFINVASNNYIEPEKKEFKGNNNNGGYNAQPKSGGTDSFEDLPF